MTMTKPWIAHMICMWLANLTCFVFMVFAAYAGMHGFGLFLGFAFTAITTYLCCNIHDIPKWALEKGDSINQDISPRNRNSDLLHSMPK